MTFFTDVRVIQEGHISKPQAPSRYIQGLSEGGFSILIRPNLPMTGQIRGGA